MPRKKALGKNREPLEDYLPLQLGAVSRGREARLSLGEKRALSALTVRKQEVIAFPELGPESVRAVEFYDFPVWVVNDCEGRDFYEQSAAPYRKNDLLPEDLRTAIDSHDANGGG